MVRFGQSEVVKCPCHHKPIVLKSVKCSVRLLRVNTAFGEWPSSVLLHCGEL
jgi:hypothetical protein